VRVVGGEVKGRHLQAPPGRAVRPTSDRVREAIFDMLASLGGLEGALVVDLFAGSGALGIEALSRGARRAVLVDDAGAAVRAIVANVAATGMQDRTTVLRLDALAWAERADAADVVFCDPPYAFDRWGPLLGRLVSRAGLVVLESGGPLDPGAGWEVLKVKHYGGTVVTVARPAHPPAGPANAKGDT